MRFSLGTGIVLGPLLLGILPASPVMGQVDDSTARAITREALAVRDSLKRLKSVKVGLSLGIRIITDVNDVNFRSPSINPADSTLSIDGIDPTDIILSGVVVVFPWHRTSKRGADSTAKSHCGWCWLGFVANITLASFNPDNVSVFNRSVEGGIGLGVRLADDFALAATYERVFSRRLRSFVKDGQQLVADGQVATSIDESDNRFFIDDNLSALSFKFIYFF